MVLFEADPIQINIVVFIVSNNQIVDAGRNVD